MKCLLRFTGRIFFTGIVAVYFSGIANALADRVKIIHEDGTLELASGDHVRFAGIELAPEALNVLKSLLADKDVELEFDTDLARTEAKPEKPAYLFVKNREMDWKPGPAVSRDIHVMINQLLIEMGAARVDLTRPFKYKNRFLESQNTAKTRGEGIWSYEPFS